MTPAAGDRVVSAPTASEGRCLSAGRPTAGASIIMSPNDAHRRQRGDATDYMSVHGYPRNTTPRIAAFAETAVTFENIGTVGGVDAG